MAPTLTGLRDIRPNVYFNVPRGLELLGAAFDNDPGLAADAFENLQTIFFAGAGLPERVRDHWLRLIDRHARRPVRLCSAWGMTETAPLATALAAPAPQSNNIGIPAPGVDIKLAPIDGCYELRVRGPNVTPGYLADAGSSAVFDADGFFKTGDVARLADEADPDAGLLYEGRLSDNFKLTSGVWVNVADLRGQLLTALGSPAQDVVLSGAGRTSLTALVVLDIEATRRLLGQDDDPGSLSRSDIVKRYIHARILIRNQTHAGLSRRISAFAIIDRALDARHGEITEKGSVNQKLILRREAAICQSLHDHLEFNDRQFEMPNAAVLE